jgi:hypothetical protein
MEVSDAKKLHALDDEDRRRPTSLISGALQPSPETARASTAETKK